MQAVGYGGYPTTGAGASVYPGYSQPTPAGYAPAGYAPAPVANQQPPAEYQYAPAVGYAPSTVSGSGYMPVWGTTAAAPVAPTAGAAGYAPVAGYAPAGYAAVPTQQQQQQQQQQFTQPVPANPGPVAQPPARTSQPSGWFF